MIWKFEDYTLNAEAFELVKGDQSLAAEPQVLSLLILLIKNRGRLLKKDEIIDEIWNGRAISDAALSSRVKSARKLIGDNGRDQRLIKTVYGNGFRFVGNVEIDQQASVLDQKSMSVKGSSTLRWQLLLFGILTLTVITIGFGWSYLGLGDARKNEDVIIAVVPITSPAEQAFGNEIATSLVSRLGDRRDFSMLSSTSSFSLANQGLTATQIAKKLRATHIIEGDLRKVGNLFNVDLRLIDGKDQRQIWSQTVQSEINDTNLLVDMVARHSAAAIQAHLEVGAGRVDVPEGTSPKAIGHYRLALESDLAYYRQQTQLNTQQLFDLARQQAPDWADAHGAFAWATLFSRPNTIALETGDQFELVREAIARAKEIDPENRWARLADGVYKTRYGTDFAGALETLSALVKDEPDWPLAHRMYAQALLVGGHYRQSVAQFKQIDALNSLPTWVGGFIRSHALRGIGRSKNNAVLAKSCEAQCFWIYSGWYDAILIKEHESVEELKGDLARLAFALKDEGADLEARALGLGDDIAGRMRETALYLKGYGPEPKDPYGRPPTMMKVDIQRGDLDAAFNHLDLFLEDWIPATAVFEFLYDDALKVFDAIRSDPRYHKMFTTLRVQALVEYRRARGLTAGLPIED